MLYVLILWVFSCVQVYGESPIDRYALVTRHNPTLREANPLSPFSVGNGEFAFTADITGLQSFPKHYEQGTPLGTLSGWGWHTIPSSTPFQLEDTYKYYETYGREAPYASQTNNPAGRWLRANPHRLHLGRVGFNLQSATGEALSIEAITGIKQTLNLWAGVLRSEFQINGHAVRVTTVAHPRRDLIAVRVESDEANLGNLPVVFSFPYGSEDWGPAMGDWHSPERHSTTVLRREANQITLKRTLDQDAYYVRIAFTGNGAWQKQGPHQFQLDPQSGEAFEFVCEFSPQAGSEALPDRAETLQASRESWAEFWTSGGAVDLHESSDPRAAELERRMVLSQYITASQSVASTPPQESGLTHNSWYGKFHLEMHWWHSVHFALWGRLPMLTANLPWYQTILPKAKQTAAVQGYSGARWPKMVGPDGREGPSGVGVFLIWQQPHPIYYAELCYRADPSRETLQAYHEVVFETAEFMASFAHWDKQEKRYVLGPPLIPAQENYSPETTYNPTFELAYWHWGLKTAQAWRKRLGMEANEDWQHVIDHLSALPRNGDVYVTTEATPDTFENPDIRRDHPSLVGALGILPDSDKVDRETMRRTLHKIFADWNWESTWGWDYPMLALTAARLDEPELAIKALQMDTPKNNFLPNGHCYQRENLPTYLPANGGLLTAIAMMAAGWDQAPDRHAPGFPNDGTWEVQWEQLEKMP